MFSLRVPEFFDIELREGVTVTVRALTSAGFATSRAAAHATLQRLEQGAQDCVAAGLANVDAMADLSQAEVRDGVFHQLLINELAVRHITGWAGIGPADGDDPPAPTPENIRTLMSMWPHGDVFYRRFTDKQLELLAAKKDFGASATGTSSRAAVPATAKGAGWIRRLVRRVFRARTGNDAPTSPTARRRMKRRRPGTS